MKEFISRYEDRIHGALSCFDRMLFRGYLPIMSGWQMAQFFNSRNIRFRTLKTFLVEQAQRVKQHGIDLANKEGRPFHYVQEKTCKDDMAQEIAARDKIDEGLIVVFSVLEPCRTFSFRFEKGKPFVQSPNGNACFCISILWTGTSVSFTSGSKPGFPFRSRSTSTVMVVGAETGSEWHPLPEI